jgi:type IV pilus assembly protein PilY1
MCFMFQEVAMTTHGLLRNASYALLALAFSATTHAALTDISTVPLNTYSAPSSTDVKPNIMFVLDDSGSMAWDYMPDHVNDSNPAFCRNSSSTPRQCAAGDPPYFSNAFNGVYYNPTINYRPPTNSDGTSKTNYNTAALWTAVKNDGYNVQSTNSTNLLTSYPERKWCNTSGSCLSAIDASGNYSYPNGTYNSLSTVNGGPFYYVTTVQWCQNKDATTGFGTTSCQSKKTSTYQYVKYGTFTRTNIVSTTSYPKAATRTDCAGATCTYTEEMTNFANWYAYYRTRMQMMKTAASLAFSSLDSATDVSNNVSRFRVGYMSINNNTSSDFLNLGEFKTSQKSNWYTKLFSAIPNNSTPLRAALATAGRLYAGKLNSTTLNGSTVTDPLQYSCQQNYAILSTDGFWNESSGYYKMDGSTDVGNQDAALPRPYYDGGSAQIQTRTSTLQSQSSQLQATTAHLQIRTRASSSASWTGWTDTAACTYHTNYPKTQCQYGSTTTANVSSCTANATTSTADGAVWNGPTATMACSTSTGAWTNASSCTASSTLNCQYTNWTSWSNVSSCTAQAQSTSPNYTVATARDCQSTTSSGTSNTLADVAAYYYSTDLRNSDATQGTGTCTGPIIAPATTTNNLCTDNVPSNGRDVATTQHMTTFTLGLGAQGQMLAPDPTKDYWSDLSGDFFDIKNGTTANPGAGICSWQTSGACNWPTPASNSETNIDDLWHAAINGHGSYFSATSPSSLSTSLSSALATIINTPRPGTAAAAASSNPNISTSDNYVFSSSYKSVEWYGELIRQQIDASGVLTAQQWSAMTLLDCATTAWAATTSYIVGSVYHNGSTCYSVTTAYTSGATFGSTDTSNTTVVNDPAGAPVVPLTARTIYTKGTSGLIPFLWGSLSGTQQAYFTKPAITYVSSSSGLSQFCASGGNCLSATAQDNNTIAAGGAAGESLVNFLRGDRSQESTYFRVRTHVLGDIVSSEGRYVKVPLFNYTDVGYNDFKTLKASRSGAVYVAANDGMLHAFDAETGKESWGYIPSMILPDLYKLADKNYSTQHQFFVDNSPETGDICPNAPTSTCTSNQWKTILVGGLSRGGKGYYALDVTNPASPSLLWEFTDANLGYTYGNPRITKLKDGTWVVIFASGYNNADGLGRLYVLNANTGALIRSISNGTGSAASPSGLARISAHAAQAMTDNTSSAVYGGDMLGNLWRFDINNDIGAAGYDAQLLVSFGSTQPITAKPTVATVDGKPVVYVGTGRYLGVNDVTDSSQQTFYAIKDNLGSTTYGNPRTAGNGFIQQSLTSGTCPSGAPATVCSPGQIVRTSSSNAVNWTTNNGWYVDFVTGGERSSTDPSLGLGTLLFTTITPNNASASACGTASTDTSASFVYALDYLTGGAVTGSGTVSAVSLGSGIATRPVLIRQSDGTVRALIRTSGGAGAGTDMGSTVVVAPTINPTSSNSRRVSWRELITE